MTQNTFTETEVANLISIACNLVVCERGETLEKGFKQITDDKTLSDRLASHIVAVIQSCRNINY
jgi:hypothetical protein